jgi:hypothetical protein
MLETALVHVDGISLKEAHDILPDISSLVRHASTSIISTHFCCQKICSSSLKRLSGRRSDRRLPERAFIVVSRKGSKFRFRLEAGYHGMAFRDREYKRWIHCLSRFIVNRVPVLSRSVVALLQRTVMRTRSGKRRLRRIAVGAGVLENN